MSDVNHNAPAEPPPFWPGSTGRVIRVPANSHPQLLALRPAEEITAVSYDERWPGYVLCGGPSGQSGWVPESVLHYIGPGMAVVRRDYCTAVLSVSMGEELVLHDEANGWYWAGRADGQAGWVLAGYVQVLSEG